MPGGRPQGPTKLRQRVVVRDPLTGTHRTLAAGAAIVEAIQTGAYAERAARSVGVSTATYYSWVDQGAAVRVLLGQNPAATLTAAQREVLGFLEAVDAAEAVYEVTGLRALEAIGLGRVTLEVVTERWQPGAPDAAGVVGPDVLVERTVKRTGMAPSAAAIQWKLTRRFPDRYQLRPDLDPSGEQPDLSAGRVGQLTEQVEQYLANMTPGEQP